LVEPGPILEFSDATDSLKLLDELIKQGFLEEKTGPQKGFEFVVEDTFAESRSDFFDIELTKSALQYYSELHPQ
jgi:hypothetical protein